MSVLVVVGMTHRSIDSRREARCPLKICLPAAFGAQIAVVGLIRSLSTCTGVTHPSPAALRSHGRCFQQSQARGAQDAGRATRVHRRRGHAQTDTYCGRGRCRYWRCRRATDNAPEALRQSLRTLSTGALITTCGRLRARRTWSAEYVATVTALRLTARRIRTLEAEAAELEAQLGPLVKQLVPQLLAEFGVGLITAAQIVCAWSHSGRLRSEAAFAALAGVAPIPASSGQVQRHRLNRSGDRALNCALHTIILCRLGGHPETQAYASRRTAQGKSSREIQRCLKRHLARREL
jgi:transposase